LYNIISEFGIPLKIVMLIKMSLSETYSKVRPDKNLIEFHSERSETKICFIVIALKLCFRICCQEGPRNQEGLKVYGTYRRLVYAGDVNILGESIYHKENHRMSVRS